MKNYELLCRKKILPHNSVESRSKFYPPRSNNGNESNPLGLVFLLCLPLCLTGCMGIYEGGFECPAGVGVGCKSISDVNTMVNQGDIPKAPAEQPITLKSEIWYAPSMYRAQNACSESTACPSPQELESQEDKKENRVQNASKSI